MDEIGNLSLPMQAKLLTAIEKRQISRLGATDIIPIDVRLISATNVNIRELVEEGNFRQDLLYRINTIEITIPPLRERERMFSYWLIISYKGILINIRKR